LEDPTFVGKIEGRIRDGAAAETALKHVVAEYVEAFVAMSDGYLRERAADVRDIGQHLLRNLLGREEREAVFAGDVVLVAHELTGIRDLPGVTTDGHRVNLYANVGLFGDLHFAALHGAEGVGLYRTEFPFLSYKDFPNEEEQLTLYRKVIERMKGRPVTIRTL